MQLIKNIIWWIFGGIETAFEYAVSGVLLCITIVGIPWGLQCFKLAMLMLLPFGSEISESESSSACLGCVGNALWILTGGWVIALTHALFGVLLCITIIGIPFGLKHFEFARLAFMPFGTDIHFGDR